MDTINLQLIKQMLIKLDKAEYEERKELREITKKYIIENVEKSCDVYVKEIKIHRNGGYGFTIHTIYIILLQVLDTLHLSYILYYHLYTHLALTI